MRKKIKMKNNKIDCHKLLKIIEVEVVEEEEGEDTSTHNMAEGLANLHLGVHLMVILLNNNSVFLVEEVHKDSKDEDDMVCPWHQLILMTLGSKRSL